MEQTLLIIKPDGVKRGLIGEIISRVERKGLRISAMKLETISSENAENHYFEHKGKGFYNELINFITSSPSIIAVIEGDNVIEILREMAGKTDPVEAETGTIRGEFATKISENVVHTSDGADSARREINNFFEI